MKPKSITPVTFKPLDAEYDKSDPMNIPWLKLGLVNQGFDDYRNTDPLHNLKSFITHPDTMIKSSKLDGVEVQEYRRRIGVADRLCQLSATHHNPVYFESVGPNYKQTTTVTYKSYPNERIFPSKILTEFVLRERLAWSKSITFELVEFDITISDSVFMMESFELKNGTPILNSKDKQIDTAPTWWNGKPDPNRTVKMVAQEMYNKNKARGIAIPDQPEPGFDWWLGSLGILVGLGACFFMLRAFRK